MLVLAPVAVQVLAGCRSDALYEPLRDPVSHLDLRLEPCPQSPNCVSSQAWDPGRRVAPIPFAGSVAEALARFARLIEAEGGRVTAQEGFWLSAEYRSRWLGFVDDLTLLADEAGGVVHVRSASRRGWHDLGVNRRRVERLREAFVQDWVPIR